MILQIRNKYLFLALCGAFSAIFLFGGYAGLQKRDRASDATQIALNEEIRQYKHKTDSMAKKTYEKNHEITTLKETIKKGNTEKAKFRKLNFKKINEITKLKLIIDSLIYINPSDSIIKDTVYIDSKPVPFIF